MRRHSVTGFLLLLTAGSIAVSQPPGGREGPPVHGPHDPLREALDTNHDHQLDADEIARAAVSLAKLDRDGDGRIDREEFRPPNAPPPGGPGDRGGFDQRPPRRPGDFSGRPPQDRRDGPPPGDDRPPPPRRGEGADGPPPPPRDGFRPEGPGGGDGPSPERFVEHAMRFDADGDGKLDRGELVKLAEEMRAMRMRGGPPGGGERFERGGPGRGPDEEAGRRGRPSGDGGAGERPPRPRRPE